MNMLSWLEENIGRRYGNFIDGEWQDAGANAVPIHNPARKEQVLGYFAESSADEVNLAVEAAHRAWKSWREVPGPDRGAILFRAADILERRVDDIAFALSAEQGKILAEARGEVMRAAKELRFCAGEASRIDGDTLPSEKRNGLAMTLREPVGVIAAIAPWNFPVVTPVRKIGPALAYGCTVVFKPSNFTPWSAAKLMDVFAEAGLPKGVVNLVLGTGRTAGEAMTRHPLVRGVSFTGSTKTGSEINAQVARRFVRTQLELGGKNPVIVFADADIEAALPVLVNAIIQNGGQTCSAGSRVLIERPVYEKVASALAGRFSKLVAGPHDADLDLGPLINEKQRDRVAGMVAAAKEAGVSVLAEGSVHADAPKGGYYQPPVLFGSVDPAAVVAQEEVFGPVLTLFPFEGEEEAVRLANSTEFGLVASVWTKDGARQHRVAKRVRAGQVFVNGYGAGGGIELPFGGFKKSGHGREKGFEALYDMSATKTVVFNHQ